MEKARFFGLLRPAEEAAAAAEAEAGAGQSPTRLDHVRMGGVGASIAAERRKLSALKKRAASNGVGADRLEAANDSEDRKASIIQLILEAASGTDESRRAQLLGEKLSALTKQAAAAGASEEALDDADDAEDPKGALVDLILQLTA